MFKTSQKKNLLNKKFGKLTVIEFSRIDKNQKARWICICDCGNKVERMASGLRKNRISHCGCLPKGLGARLAPEESGLNVVISYYKSNAKKRNVEYSLSKEEAKNLFKSKCHYCNKEPENLMIKRKSYCRLIYNGIDRKNNDKGYTTQNCVTCCKDCNYLKNKRNYEEFLSKINTIYTNLRK